MESDHLGRILRLSRSSYADHPAQGFRVDGAWQTRSYRKLGEEVDRVARALIASGLDIGDRVAIFSPNRAEWSIADFAIVSAGGISVPIFATSSLVQAEHILHDADVEIAFVSGDTEREILTRAAGDRPIRIISFDPASGANESIAGLDDPGPGSSTDSELENRLRAGRSDDLATLIYTSGTTGMPKGVMLTHANFAHQSRSVAAHFDVGPGDCSLCFLPLAHVYERSWTAHLLASGACNYYLPDPKEVITALAEVRPNVMVSVPRLYEKVHDAVHDRATHAPPLRKAIFFWGLGVGQEVSQRQRAGRRLGLGLKFKHKLADRLVLSKIRDVVGGDKKFFSAGGAPLAREIEEFFHATGLLICQGYGLTESSPMATYNTPSCFRFGSVGKAVPECEVKIGDNDEVLIRGPNIMKGYLNRPDATAETLEGGWLHTGDQGRFDDDGFLYITGRIKDLIITSGGKNIAPQIIESAIARDPFIDQIAVIGDQRKYLTALVVPNFEAVENWASNRDLTFTSHEQLVTNPEIVKEFQRRIEDQSAELARFEQIKGFRLLPRELRIDEGELTPTLKIRRAVVNEHFADLIENMYSAGTSAQV